jgi:hypothetical protein
MDLKHFGDSYDIVKKSLIAWLLDLGPWSAHPMFTHHVNSAAAQKFARFLGVPLLSRERLHSESDRIRYFSVCDGAQHVFVDPDTGLKVTAVAASKAPHFLLSDDLMRLVKARPGYLTLTFDQALSRGTEPQPQIRAKLTHFAANGLHSFAYVSHASFIIFGCRRTEVERAYKTVLTKSGLPARCFVRSRIRTGLTRR